MRNFVGIGQVLTPVLLSLGTNKAPLVPRSALLVR